jgi:hypothetical protein
VFWPLNGCKARRTFNPAGAILYRPRTAHA